MTLDIPICKALAPMLDIQLHEHHLAGLTSKLAGYTSLNIGEILEEFYVKNNIPLAKPSSSEIPAIDPSHVKVDVKDSKDAKDSKDPKDKGNKASRNFVLFIYKIPVNYTSFSRFGNSTSRVTVSNQPGFKVISLVVVFPFFPAQFIVTNGSDVPSLSAGGRSLARYTNTLN